jgi:hypothetical protein
MDYVKARRLEEVMTRRNTLCADNLESETRSPLYRLVCYPLAVRTLDLEKLQIGHMLNVLRPSTAHGSTC